MLTKSHSVRTAAGHRSKGEDQCIAQLIAEGIEHHYEKIKIPYTVPASQHYYLTDVALGALEDTPKPIILDDIIIGSIRFFIEHKGYPFTSADRKKYILVRDQNPKIDLRFIFTNVNRKISKNSKTTCGQWAEKNGFKYAHQTIPEAWIQEARV